MKKKTAVGYAILAAALYAINVPISKILLNHIGTTMMAAFLYLGAVSGLLIYSLIGKTIGNKKKQERLTKKELPFTVEMVVLDILAPIFLMLGIQRTNSANVSLLNNFEIVIIKGCFSGMGSMLVALFIGEKFPALKWIILVLLLGFIAYGLSINFYIRAQNQLGAAKTS